MDPIPRLDREASTTVHYRVLQKVDIYVDWMALAEAHPDEVRDAIDRAAASDDFGGVLGELMFNSYVLLADGNPGDIWTPGAIESVPWDVEMENRDYGKLDDPAMERTLTARYGPNPQEVLPLEEGAP